MNNSRNYRIEKKIYAQKDKKEIISPNLISLEPVLENILE